MATRGAGAGTTRGADAGAVTVEAALALCSLVAVMVLALGAVLASAAQLRCLDAAREAARLVARGEPVRAREAAVTLAPRGARIDVRVVGDEVRVEVTADPLGAALPGVRVAGGAVGVLEPGVLAAEPP